MIREKFKWRSHKSESTDAEHGGGLTRSSDEVSVMEMERRGEIPPRHPTLALTDFQGLKP